MLTIFTRILTDVRAGATTSILSAGISIDIQNMPTIQYIAIVIAILSGLVAIINGCDAFYLKHKHSFKARFTSAWKVRLFRHWETSLLGLFILIICAVAILTGRATLSELWPGIPIIAFLLYKRTPFKKLPNENSDS